MCIRDRLKGVEETRVGYAQGSLENPNYAQVKRQISGHAECVRIVYDSDQITLEQLFDHLFRIIDPTSLNRQGNDVGTSYRTGIYPACAEDEAIARQFVAERQKDYDLSLIHIFCDYRCDEMDLCVQDVTHRSPQCESARLLQVTARGGGQEKTIYALNEMRIENRCV